MESFSRPAFHPQFPYPGPAYSPWGQVPIVYRQSAVPRTVFLDIELQKLVVSIHLIDEPIQFSGTIVDSRGIIVTAANLLGTWRSAEKLQETEVVVTLNYPSSRILVRGKVVYADFLHDVAFIRIQPCAELPAAKLGSAENLCAQYVLVAGRHKNFRSEPMTEFFDEMTRVKRVLRALFGEQLRLSLTGLKPERRPDGGPVFNCAGEVVGMMTGETDAISMKIVSDLLDLYSAEWVSASSGRGELKMRMFKVTADDPYGILAGVVAAKINGTAVQSLKDMAPEHLESYSSRISLEKENEEAAEYDCVYEAKSLTDLDDTGSLFPHYVDKRGGKHRPQKDLHAHRVIPWELAV